MNIHKKEVLSKTIIAPFYKIFFFETNFIIESIYYPFILFIFALLLITINTRIVNTLNNYCIEKKRFPNNNPAIITLTNLTMKSFKISGEIHLII